MQKHQEWLDNRTYEQHLLCLTKIKQNCRKSQVKSAAHCRRRRASHKNDSTDQLNAVEGEGNNTSQSKVHKNFKITNRDKDLLWNNFLIGKRIMETTPVINVKKQEDEYKKHKKILDWRIQRSKKLATNTGFRDTKLKQYTINSHRLSNCHRLDTAARSRFILCLKIINLVFNRPCHALEDIILKLRTEGKKTIQTSEIVNVSRLSSYEFFFKYFLVKDASQIGNALLVDFFEIKGLEERHLGGFSIERQNIGAEKTSLTAQMRKGGKVIGEVAYEVFIFKRSNLKQTF